MNKIFEAPKATVIYVFRINDEAHKGCLKIGEASIDEECAVPISQRTPNSSLLNKAARKRINQYTQTAGIAYELLYTESGVYETTKGFGYFNDKDVHGVLLRSGIKRKVFEGGENKGREWFITDLETVKKAIRAVKENRTSLYNHEVSLDRSPIIFRPEQRAAIDKTKERFKHGKMMLWNAKMRFGKTLSALQVVKEMEYTRTLILTHRPVVDEGWFKDFKKIFYDTPSYEYSSKKNGEISLEKLERDVTTKHKKYVYFASMQDLRGSELVGGKFDKNSTLFAIPWDLLIVDEAHEGTQTKLGQEVTKALLKANTLKLDLSGTPFNLLSGYREEEIFTWDYVMEQNAKEQWDAKHFGDPNPYACLPKLHIFTYNLGELFKTYADATVAFNFHEFFRTTDSGKFIHERDIRAFLDLLCKSDDQSRYPYSTKEYRNIFRHTLWMLPGVREARALSALLSTHPVFGTFQIVNVAGDGDEDEENGDALEMVEAAITENPEDTYTITLSCGRLTAGVSVKAWTGVLMLAGSYNTAASTYMQTIFRVQTPATLDGRMKTDCYVFDFAPDRTLQVLAEVARVSHKPGKTGSDERKKLGEFLNFCPVIAMSGSTMETLNVAHMLQQLKKVYIERVVRNGFEDNYLYNDKLRQLTKTELEAFEDLKKTIGQTKAIATSGKVDINEQGLTKEEYEEQQNLERKKKKGKDALTPEEKQRLEELKKERKNREAAISILRGISIRMPLLIFGAEITDEDKELTIDNFADLVDDASWKEFMPDGVTKELFGTFKQYYDEEIFSAAGKRIRVMTRAADGLTIEERMNRLAVIFGSFRNPDKETVLTPWRVVNMHMAKTLGGYCFFDDDFSEPIEEPRYVNQGDITANVFGKDSHLVEINSKSGLYPLYMAYSVYRSRLQSCTYAPEDLAGHQRLWDEVIRKNIFVVCKTKMAKQITKRTLVGFRDVKPNMWAPDDLINKVSHQPELFIKKVHDLVGKGMKINAVVGNPPYQEMDGGSKSSSRPLYHYFVDISRKMNPDYCSMIMPAKWYNGGKGLDEFRASMLTDNHIRVLFDYADSNDCFAGVDIAGGICYFLWDKGYQGYCLVTTSSGGETHVSKRDLNERDTFIRNAQALSIVKKIEGYKGLSFFDEIVSARKPFGLPTNTAFDKKGDLVLRSNRGKGPLKVTAIITNHKLVPKWKVIISYLTYDHAGRPDKNGQKRILSTMEILAPNEVCTETYLVVDSFDTEKEAVNLIEYLKTKFVRFLINQVTATQHITRNNFSLVPVLDFTKQWDDAKLNSLFNLSQEDVALIDRTIKSME